MAVEAVSLDEATRRAIEELKSRLDDPTLEPVDKVYADFYAKVLPLVTERQGHWIPRVGLGTVGDAMMRLAATLAVQILLSARANGVGKDELSDEAFLAYAAKTMRQAMRACEPRFAISTGPRLDS